MCDEAPAATGVAISILVPFRIEMHQNREAHLAEFLHRVPGTLDLAIGAGRWAMFIVEQSRDGQKFSRARCLNAAARLAISRFPGATLVLHDVDLIPDVERARGYAIPPPRNGVMALNSDSAKYGTCGMYIGGICSIDAATFSAVNGFQNSFKGWGGEDDCLRDAIRAFNSDRDWLRSFTDGVVVDLENSDPPTCRRACHVPEFKCERETKNANRRHAAENGFKDGLEELVFEVTAIKKYPEISLNITFLTCNLFVEPAPGWRMAISKKRNIPYYYRLLTGETTFAFNGSRACDPLNATATGRTVVAVAAKKRPRSGTEPSPQLSSCAAPSLSRFCSDAIAVEEDTNRVTTRMSGC